MIRILIVEDEMLVRLGMKMCLDEYSASMKVIEAFASAKEALTYCKENRVDILLTDIRLPKMSGLLLIEEVKPICPNMMIVVLSCYEDFAYARRAYELGVDKYLLKQELLEDDLPRMLLELYEKKNKVTGNMILEKVENKETVEGIYKIGCFLLVHKETCRSVENSEIQYAMVCEIIQEILNTNHLGKCYLRHGSELFCIFHFDKDKKEAECEEQIGYFYKNIASTIGNVFDKEVFFGTSNLFSKLVEVNEQYAQTKKQLEYSFYFSHGQWIKPTYVKKEKKEKKKIKILPSAILAKQGLDAFQAELEAYMEQNKVHFVPIEEVKEEMVHFVYEISSYLEKSYGLKMDTIFLEGEVPGYVLIHQCSSKAQLIDLLMQMVETMSQYIEKGNRKESTTFKICCYIEEHYDKPLSLSEVSEKFHMNTVYFCQYFKKEMGVNFIQYLNTIRIEEAKKLLRTTEDTVETIALKVGIDNPNYFFRLFKKMTGLTVGEYKKQIFIL